MNIFCYCISLLIFLEHFPVSLNIPSVIFLYTSYSLVDLYNNIKCPLSLSMDFLSFVL